MGLHQFLLDAAINEAKDIKRSEEASIYLDADGVLNAWITSHDQSNRTTLKAFRENTEGTMILQDLLKPDLPVQILGLESNGCLLARTEQGILRYRCTNGKIIGQADTRKNKDKKLLSADFAAPVLFPGMQQSDSLCCGDLVISRHETIAKSPYGEPFFPQSLLLIKPGCDLKTTKEVPPWIAIGNSHIDNELNLISCSDRPLFDIPISNFVVDCPQPDSAAFLIGWNRKALQVISIDQDPNDQHSIHAQTYAIIELKDSVLEDASKPWINDQGRLSFWRDKLNAGQFYTWCRDESKN